MHAEARAYVASIVQGQRYGNVVEIGGRDINGRVSDLFTADVYLGIDLYPGVGVDVVADCREWTPPAPADLVLCCEVLEHSDDPAGVVKAAVDYLAAGGRLVLTAAGPGRTPHSGHDGGQLRDDEPYGNIDPADLEAWLSELADVEVRQVGVDVQATGVKPRKRRR